MQSELKDFDRLKPIVLKKGDRVYHSPLVVRGNKTIYM